MTDRTNSASTDSNAGAGARENERDDMAHVEKGQAQVSVTTIGTIKPEAPAEYAISVLRVIARKDEGEPLTGQEREAARMALRVNGRDW